MLAQNDVMSFYSLFSGAKEFYGTTKVGAIVNGKAESTSQALHEPPSPTIYQSHLQGTVSIGISPLKADNTVSFGAIDIDDYEGDLKHVISAIYYHDLPICPCYSKSKKLHLYFFFEAETAAEDAVEVMRWYARAFACNKKVEVFPKQIQRSLNAKAYSWINLPYFEADNEDNHRKMVKEDFTYASLPEFILRAKTYKWSLQSHKNKIATIPCHDAPPCILTGVMLRDIGQGGRNAWLFSTAVYLKLKDEAADLEELLTTINESLYDPLPEKELHDTILKSLAKQSYFYLCNQLQRCDKVSCYKLEHGIGAKQASGLTYGKLTQIMSDPPTYKWDVNGQTMDFDSEAELLTQSKFRALCLRQLHRVPKPVSDDIWSRILTKASENIEVVYPDTRSGDFSIGSVFYDHVCGFFNEKRKAQNISQVHLGRVYVDEGKKEYVFTASALVSYLKDTKNFKGLNNMEMRRKMEEMGAYKIGPVWRMPTSAIPEEDLNKTNRAQVDVNLHEGESSDF